MKIVKFVKTILIDTPPWASLNDKPTQALY
jgi:hypothetical protein